MRAAVGCVCAVGLRGWLRVCCWAVIAVCVLAMWLKVWLQDDTYFEVHDTSRITRAIPVVDRSNNSLLVLLECSSF